MSGTNPLSSAGGPPSAAATARALSATTQSLKRSVQAAFDGTYFALVHTSFAAWWIFVYSVLTIHILLCHSIGRLLVLGRVLFYVHLLLSSNRQSCLILCSLVAI